MRTAATILLLLFLCSTGARAEVTDTDTRSNLQECAERRIAWFTNNPIAPTLPPVEYMVAVQEQMIQLINSVMDCIIRDDVPANPIPVNHDEEAYRGQDLLVSKVMEAGGPKGLVLIIDGSFSRENNRHYERVKEDLIANGVPEENIRGNGQYAGSSPGNPNTYWHNRFLRDDDMGIRDQTKVVAMPIAAPFIHPGTAVAIAKHNVLFVAGAGNTPIGEDGWSDLTKRDMYSPEYYTWEEDNWGFPEGHSSYQETMDTLATGKAILAVWADVDEEGNIVPYASSVMCGDAKEACFTVILDPPRQRSHGEGTSFATPLVASAAYYLRQLWDDAEEVVQVMSDCAIDIGKPGVDREFGKGAVNVECDRVANREIDTVDSSITVKTSTPTLDKALSRSTATVPTFASAPFAPNSDHSPDMFVGANYMGIGKSLTLFGTEEDATELSLFLGTGQTPLGVSSSFLPKERTVFTEVGIHHPLLTDEHNTLSLVGSIGKDTTATVLRAGVHYNLTKSNHSLLLYAGAANAQGSIGIPGHTEVYRDPVPFSVTNREARLTYRYRF